MATAKLDERWADEATGTAYEKWTVQCGEYKPQMEKGMKLLAIDPGKSGGLVIYDTQAKNFDLIISLPMLGKPKDKGRRVDVGKLQNIIIRYKINRAVIELQQTRGRQANQGIIKLNYGRITAVLELCGVDYDELGAKVWQAALHGCATSDKHRTIDYLLERGYHVPMTSSYANASYHDGCSDAMGIALAYAEMLET